MKGCSQSGIDATIDISVEINEETEEEVFSITALSFTIDEDKMSFTPEEGDTVVVLGSEDTDDLDVPLFTVDSVSGGDGEPYTVDASPEE